MNQPRPAANSRRRFLAGGAAAVIATAVVAHRPAFAQGAGLRASDFGCDLSGRSVTPIERVTEWLLAASRRGVPAILDAGTLLIAATPGTDPMRGLAYRGIDLTGRTLEIRGAGMGRSTIRRAGGSIRGNGEALLRFFAGGTDGSARLLVNGLTLDMDAMRGNVVPGGKLSDNFAWQHNGCLEILHHRGARRAFALIDCRDVEIRDPIADGISIRGGHGFRTVRLDNIRNERWPLDAKRPRVRGDVTITGIADLVTITGGRLPRLHFERDSAIGYDHTMQVAIRNAEVGEFLNHNPGNAASRGGRPERIQTQFTGGSIAYRAFAGGAITAFSDTAITAQHVAHRLTEGDTFFKNVRFIVGPDFSGDTGAESGLIRVTLPYARNVRIAGCSVASEARQMPAALCYFGDNAGGLTGTLQIEQVDFDPSAAAMGIAILRHSDAEIRSVTSPFSGPGGAIRLQPGRAPGKMHSSLLVENCTMTGRGELLALPVAGPGARPGGWTVTARGNRG